MDPDMNKYDLEHVVTAHPKMSKAEWQEVSTRSAWETFYTPEHMETIMKRERAKGINLMPSVLTILLVLDLGPRLKGFIRCKAGSSA